MAPSATRPKRPLLKILHLDEVSASASSAPSAVIGILPAIALRESRYTAGLRNRQGVPTAPCLGSLASYDFSERLATCTYTETLATCIYTKTLLPVSSYATALPDE